MKLGKPDAQKQMPSALGFSAKKTELTVCRMREKDWSTADLSLKEQRGLVRWTVLSPSAHEAPSLSHRRGSRQRQTPVLYVDEPRVGKGSAG